MNSPFNHVLLSGAQKNLLDNGTGILCYHYLGTVPRKSNDPFLYVEPERFRAQVSALRDAGYTSGNLSDLVGGANEVPRNAKKIILTVDDGARNFHDHGMAVLAESGFRAIQFIVSGQIGSINEWDAKHGHPRIDLMDEAQIREWLAEGHEIGSHSMNHRNLSKLGEREAKQQIFDSKAKLEDTFGVEIRHFSYPHGKFTTFTRNLVAEAGYETACTTRFGVHRPGGDPFELPRIQPLSAGELFGKAIHRVCQKLRLRP